MSVSVKISGGNKLIAALKKLSTLGEVKLKVGVLKGARDSQGEPVAPRAFYNEFGTVNIPARPAFRNTVADKASNWADGLGTLVQGRATEPGVMEGAFQELGGLMVTDIQDTIGAGVGPGLAESTIKAKTRRGLAAATLQLVAKADFQSSISYEVSKK